MLHFALIEKIVGKIPKEMLEAGSSRKRRHFDEEGKLRLEELHRSEREHVGNMKSLKVSVGRGVEM